jgi:hypothetical protein
VERITRGLVDWPRLCCSPFQYARLNPRRNMSVQSMGNFRSVRFSFDPHAFAGRRKRVVSTRNGLGLDYRDMQGMQLRTRFTYRRKPTPEWSLNDEQLREVVAGYMECRYSLKQGPNSLLERLARADVAARQQLPELNALIDRYSREYVATENPTYKRYLEIQIEGKDTQVRIAEKLVALVTSVAYLYHRLKMNSVGVAEELGMKPPHVRMILYRLNIVSERIKGGTLYVRASSRPQKNLKWNLTLALSLREAGHTHRQIAARLGVSCSSITRGFQAFDSLGMLVESQM